MSLTVERRTCDANEFARIFGVHPNSVRNSVRLHGHALGVPALRLGRKILFSMAAVEKRLDTPLVSEEADDHITA